MSDKEADIVIVGAGLTGLTMAYYLTRVGKNVLLLDKNTRAGGVIETVSEDGFIYEKGPNTGVIGTTELVELFNDLQDEVTIELPATANKSRWIWKNGKWHVLPTAHQGVTTRLFKVKDKLRLLGEPFRKRGTNPDETLAEMVVRRLGQSFLDYAVDPFVSGIYAGDPHRLVARYALPKLYNLEQEYGSFIKGAHKKHLEPKTGLEKRVTREVFSVQGGLTSLIDGLSRKIGTANIILGISGLRVNYTSKGYSCTFRQNHQEMVVVANKVITTCNGKTLPGILPFIPEALVKAVSNADYARVIQVVVGYNKWEGIALTAFGGLVPSREKRDILGILFPSSLFKSRVPEGGALLSVFLGGIKNPGILLKRDAEIEKIVLSEISIMLGCTVTPDLLKIFRYERAIPQYEKSTGERLQAIDIVQGEYPGLILAGNIRDGIGMADRVKQARQIANLITQ